VFEFVQREHDGVEAPARLSGIPMPSGDLPDSAGPPAGAS
jgi:hypothetical protein